MLFSCASCCQLDQIFALPAEISTTTFRRHNYHNSCVLQHRYHLSTPLEDKQERTYSSHLATVAEESLIRCWRFLPGAVDVVDYPE